MTPGHFHALQGLVQLKSMTHAFRCQKLGALIFPFATPSQLISTLAATGMEASPISSVYGS